MTNKQIVAALKNNRNLCEIALEYPSSIPSTTPRHLCTSTEPPKVTGHLRTNIVWSKVPSEHHKTKDSSKSEKDGIEVIQLIYDKQEKINKKCRGRFINNEDKRDNTN